MKKIEPFSVKVDEMGKKECLSIKILWQKLYAIRSAMESDD